MLDKQIQPALNRNTKSPILKLLLIVRPSTLVNLLRLELSHQDYQIEVAYDGMSGLLRYRETKPQLIILDWDISLFSAADLCCRLKNGDNSILVLDFGQQKRDRQLGFNDYSTETDLNNSSRIQNRVAALDAGADDCISFPFAITEFFARIRVQLRKYQVPKQSVLIFEDLRLDTSTREVYRGDRYIYLTTREFTLLAYLLLHPRQVLSREQILGNVWGYDYLGDSNIIEVYIRYLRLKLEQNNSKRLIYTVRSVGYALRESSFY